MKLTVNGKSYELGDASSVMDLLRERNLDPIRVAVEVNEDIVFRRDIAERRGSRGNCHLRRRRMK